MKIAKIKGRFVAIRRGRVFITADIQRAFDFLRGK